MIQVLTTLIGAAGGAAIMWLLELGRLPSVQYGQHLIPSAALETGAGALVGALVGYLLQPSASNPIVLKLGGIQWTMEDFCRGWLITGRTGSGKTASGIANMMSQLFERVPNWGGLAVDQKGVFWEILMSMGQHYKAFDRVVLLKVRGPQEPTDWTPRWTYNLIANPEVPASAIAEALIDAATSRGLISKDGSAGSHFASAAKVHIAQAIMFFRYTRKVPSLLKVYNFLSQGVDSLTEELQELKLYETHAAAEIYNHFSEKFLSLGGDELSGTRSTITNILYFYCDPDIAAVFCAEKPTFRMSMLDEGKIVCVSVPQKFATERQLINTLLKLDFYKHALERFDKPRSVRKKFNLLVLWADEAQRVVTKSEMGMADHNTVDQTREARVTVILATQAERSFVPLLGRDITNTLVDNLGNELIYTVTNEEDAEKASKRIGQRPVLKRSSSWGKGGASYSTQEQIEGFIRPHELRNLKKFEVVIRHCEGRFQRTTILPTRFTSRSTPEETSSEEKSEQLTSGNEIELRGNHSGPPGP